MNQLEKEKMIKKECRALKRLFSGAEKKNKAIAYKMCERAAFMIVTLQELESQINQDGATELFEQGSQKMLREHPATKSYNAMIKNFNATIKVLSDLMQDEAETQDELMEFLSQRKK